MKLLESTRFEAINNALSITTGDNTISGRIESYSCKLAGGDKALYKRFSSEQGNRELQALSPPQTHLGMSPGQGTYSNSSAIAELDWKNLQTIPLNFSMKILSESSEDLLLYSKCCKKVVFVRNLKECIEKEAEPKCQHLALSSTIIDCFSRKTWLDSDHNFHYENVKVSKVLAVGVCQNAFVLVRNIDLNIELNLFVKNTKSVIHKRIVPEVSNVNFVKVIVKKTSITGKSIYLGFLILDDKCFKFFVDDLNIIMDDKKSKVNITNIVDVIFPYSTIENYYFLTKYSNLYCYSNNVFTKIKSGIHWKAYCLLNNDTFLVSDGLHLYQCVLGKDLNLSYEKLNLNFILSIVYIRSLNIALCNTGHRKFYMIKPVDEIAKTTKSFVLDADNVDSTLGLRKKIEQTTDDIEALNKEIERQNLLIKDLAVISRSNLLSNFFKCQVDVLKLAHFEITQWYTKHVLEIDGELSNILSKSSNIWYYNIYYLNDKLQFINKVFKTYKNKPKMEIIMPCELYCRTLRTSIHEMLVDGDCKIGVKIKLPHKYIETSDFISLKSPDFKGDSNSNEIYNIIDQLAIGSSLSLKIYTEKPYEVLVTCDRQITYDHIKNIFIENIENKSEDIDKLVLEVTGNAVKLKIPNDKSRILLSSTDITSIAVLKKFLIKKLNVDARSITYASQVRMHLENKIRFLKTEMLKPVIDLTVLHQLRRNIRQMISSQFIKIHNSAPLSSADDALIVIE